MSWCRDGYPGVREPGKEFLKNEPGKSAAGIRSANIILGNVHQIYDGKDNWQVIYENCDRLRAGARPSRRVVD